MLLSQALASVDSFRRILFAVVCRGEATTTAAMPTPRALLELEEPFPKFVADF